MNPMFEKYQGAPWFVHTEKDPYAQTSAKVWEELAKLRVKYPMVPGTEMVYLDDTTPEGISREDYKAGNNNLFVFKKGTFDSAEIRAKNADEKRLIFYVHGGGFVRGNGKYCRVNAINQVQKIGLSVAACEYRTAPEYKEPCALADVEESYNFVVNNLGYDPSGIIILGDSAGGTLGLGLCNRLKAQGKKLPGACVWFSPCLDLTLSFDSHRVNIGKDLFFPKPVAAVIPLFAPDPSRYKNPEVSPYWGDFAGFPPTYFCVEDTEVFCSDSLEAAAKMHSAGVTVKCHAFHGLWHTFPLTCPTTPMADVVFQEVKAFIG
ncbi:MAG: alpha/beta hydrolase [Spirochaetaceae bacterium]|jgi:acetyl esterase/lipase|nr:alpha/beta hydrolase [Spirochaetaceae bacterium]